MRAAVIEAVGRPPVIAEVPLPDRGPGEALVRILGASLNPVERHISSGRFFDGPPMLPYVAGVEGVGVVEEGSRLAPGTRVRVEVIHPGYGRDGVLAEYAVLPEAPDERDRSSQAMAFPVGDGVGDLAAAAAGASGYTALMLLERAAEAGAELHGAHVLVLAATGVVGSCAAQLARSLGAARVVCAGRNPGRLARARELGADATVELEEGLGAGELRERFLDAAGGRVDLVLDPLWRARRSSRSAPAACS
jgi:NADPH:quinone reductase-like Zn-dependent oxidoreductase